MLYLGRIRKVLICEATLSLFCSMRFLFSVCVCLVFLPPQLVQLQEQLHSVDDGPSLDIVRAIQQISRDMHMITFYLRPMKMVATQLITVRCLMLVQSV